MRSLAKIHRFILFKVHGRQKVHAYNHYISLQNALEREGKH